MKDKIGMYLKLEMYLKVERHNLKQLKNEDTTKYGDVDMIIYNSEMLKSQQIIMMLENIKGEYNV